MRPIAPRLEDAEEVTVAEEQHEYMPIVAAFIGDTRVCRWTFTPDERQQVANGADLYFWTPASVMLTPHNFTVERRDG